MHRGLWLGWFADPAQVVFQLAPFRKRARLLLPVRPTASAASAAYLRQLVLVLSTPKAKCLRLLLPGGPQPSRPAAAFPSIQPELPHPILIAPQAGTPAPPASWTPASAAPSWWRPPWAPAACTVRACMHLPLTCSIVTSACCGTLALGLHAPSPSPSPRAHQFNASPPCGRFPFAVNTLSLPAAFDVTTDPRAPSIHKVVEPEEIQVRF